MSDSPQRIERYERERGEGLQVADGAGRLVMPGLINLHNHVSMTLMRGYADDLPLMPWLTEKIWPFEAKLDGDDIYSGAELGIAEMLLGGTTAFVDMYWYADRVAEAADPQRNPGGRPVRLSSGRRSTVTSNGRSG